MQIFRELFSFLLGNFWTIYLGTLGQFTNKKHPLLSRAGDATKKT